MVKTGVFKKIAALTAAVAMVGAFAASASAVKVETTTQYLADSNNAKVNVVANVSDLGGAVEVTYYATKTVDVTAEDGTVTQQTDVVYVDQTTAKTDGTATFDYVTDATDLKSDVKVGYTNASKAEDATVPGYTISVDGITAVTVPTKEINGAHVLAYTLADGKVFKEVTAEGATVVEAGYAEGKLTVVLADATGDVALTVVADNAIVQPDAKGTFVDSAAIISDGKADYKGEEDVNAEAGDRKVTVIAQVSESADYGIIVSADAIKAGVVDTLPAGAYAARSKNDAGYFAVQVIDNGEDVDGALFQSGKAYNTAIYYKNANTGKYTIVVGNAVEAN